MTRRPLRRCRPTRPPGHRPGRASFAALLLLSLLAATLELHTADHDPLSDVAAAQGGTRVVTDAHPERSAACFERAAEETVPRCLGCLQRLQSAGGHLLPPAHAALPAPAGLGQGAAAPFLLTADRHPATSRGPPILL